MKKAIIFSLMIISLSTIALVIDDFRVSRVMKWGQDLLLSGVYYSGYYDNISVVSRLDISTFEFDTLITSDKTITNLAVDHLTHNIYAASEQYYFDDYYSGELIMLDSSGYETRIDFDDEIQPGFLEICGDYLLMAVYKARAGYYDRSSVLTFFDKNTLDFGKEITTSPFDNSDIIRGIEAVGDTSIFIGASRETEIFYLHCPVWFALIDTGGRIVYCDTSELEDDASLELNQLTGQFIIGGMDTDFRGSVCSISSDGDSLEYYYDPEDSTVFNDISISEDGFIYAAGNSGYPRYDYSNTRYITKITPSGIPIWSSEYEDTLGWDIDNFVICLSPDTIVAISTGYTGSNYSTIIALLDSYGDTISTHGLSETYSLPRILDLRIAPNPFNSAVSIISPANGTIEIFDLNGRSIAYLPGGEQIWKPESSVGSGIYLVRAKFDDESIVKRIVYLK